MQPQMKIAIYIIVGLALVGGVVWYISNVQRASSPPAPTSTKTNDCVAAGCSGQLCVSESEAADVVTTCEFRAEYACYKQATCERQTDGKCDWTQTPELQSCLANPPALDATPQVY